MTPQQTAVKTTALEFSASKHDPILKQRLSDYIFDVPDAESPFSKRLARENGWDDNYALDVIEEYRRFVYMVCVSGETLTPSDEVDQVWHLHLSYSRAYWETFCPLILQRPLHHDPTQGGESEGKQFESNYRRTLELYTAIFYEVPPKDIWPPVAIRFGYAADYVRVNRGLFVIAPKRNLLASRRPRTTKVMLIVLGLYIVASVALHLYFNVAVFPLLFGFIALLMANNIVAAKKYAELTKGAGVVAQKQHGYTVLFTVSATTALGFSVEISGAGDATGSDAGTGDGDSGCGGGCGGD